MRRHYHLHQHGLAPVSLILDSLPHLTIGTTPIGLLHCFFLYYSGSCHLLRESSSIFHLSVEHASAIQSCRYGLLAQTRSGGRSWNCTKPATWWPAEALQEQHPFRQFMECSEFVVLFRASRLALDETSTKMLRDTLHLVIHDAAWSFMAYKFAVAPAILVTIMYVLRCCGRQLNINISVHTRLQHLYGALSS